MKTIEEIKSKILKKHSKGKLNLPKDFKKLPKNDDLREFVCGLGKWPAYFYALEVDKGPTDITRKFSCVEAKFAYLYALRVDKSPRDDTREIACQDPTCAVCYAVDVDKCPRDDTREASCKDPMSAYTYAMVVDKGITEETQKAVANAPHYGWQYRQNVKDKKPAIETTDKPIEEIKIDLTLKKLSCTPIRPETIISLPKDDDLREFICTLNPSCAYWYAKFVDRDPHDSTRKASSKDFIHAYNYALEIDKGPHDITRQGVCTGDKVLNGELKKVYEYITEIDKGPHDVTREVYLGTPANAFFYAKNVDKCSRDDTRESACKNPEFACRYALEVDKGPTDITRKASCEKPDIAFSYAISVDKYAHEETRESAYRDLEYKELYIEEFGE